MQNRFRLHRPLLVALIVSFGIVSVRAQANLRSQQLSLKTPLSAPRWMFDPSQKVENSPAIKALAEMRRFSNDKKWIECLKANSKLLKLAPSLSPWITRQRLFCAQELAKSGGGWKSLALATAAIEARNEWLVWGAYSEALRKDYLEGLLTLLELQMKSSRKLAWKTFETLLGYETSLAKDQKAKVFQLGGELAFVEQNLKKALGFFERSIESKPTDEVELRLAGIRSKLLGEKAGGETGKGKVSTPSDPSLLMGEEENKIYETFKRALESKEYVSAVEDGMKLITKFPGGSASLEADNQILKIYLTVTSEKQEEFRLLKQRIIKQMKNGDADRLLRWAENAYWKSHYADVLVFAEEAYEKYNGQKKAAQALLLAAKSAMYIGENSDAEKFFKNLNKKFSGTNEAEEALFLLGLSHLRKAEYSEAAAQFERLLALTQNEKWIYRAQYWHWRSLQKFNKERSVSVAQKLIEKFPLTYYGLRARAELNGNRLGWPESSPKLVSEELWLSGPENLAWQRFQILLKAGWFEEAQFELSSLPEPYTPQAQAVMARLWSLSMNYHQAITMMNAAWDEDASLRSKDLIDIIFPKEFKFFVTREVEPTTIDPNMVYSVIRQESSFRPKAVSGAGARGLMQLMVPTAKDMLKPAEAKSFVPEDLLRAELNVKLGVRYLERLKKYYKGHLPLSLAAYNAGIGRVNRWLAGRPETTKLKETLSSDPFAELWVDELPWDETSDYVKSVLRNYLIYQMLDAGEFALKDPLWLPSGT